MQSRGMNRRGFLKTAVSAAVGAVGFPYFVSGAALGKDGSVPASERITIGVIGTGGQGRGDMMGFLSKKEARVVAVCDVDDKRLYSWGKNIVDQRYNNKDCAAYKDWRQVIARDDIDAVLTATPDHWHAIIAIAAARAGKHIHGQKPLAYNIAEGRAIVEAVKRYGIVWQTGSQQRSDRNFRFACELVRNGCLGKVNLVKVGLPNNNMIFGDGWNTPAHEEPAKPAPVPEGFDYDMWLGPAPWKPYSAGRCHWNFRWISDYAHGQISDWAGHHCDIAQWAMNTEHTSPVEVEGKGQWPENPIYDTVENYRFVCKYKEGFTMIVDGSLARGVRFEGSDGWVFVSREAMEAHPKSLLDTKFGPNDVHLYESDDHKQNFLDCIRSGRECVAPVEVGHRSIMIGHLGVIAMKVGRKVKWDGERERFVDDKVADSYLSRAMRSPWRV